jgi:hypothetical protein
LGPIHWCVLAPSVNPCDAQCQQDQLTSLNQCCDCILAPSEWVASQVYNRVAVGRTPGQKCMVKLGTFRNHGNMLNKIHVLKINNVLLRKVTTHLSCIVLATLHFCCLNNKYQFTITYTGRHSGSVMGLYWNTSISRLYRVFNRNRYFSRKGNMPIYVYVLPSIKMKSLHVSRISGR